MCGIAGMMMIGHAPPGAGLLGAMAEALAHRGPDGRRIHTHGPVGLIHNRLAIIDLLTGDQPLHEPGGGTLVGNGEIYNYIELRQALHGVNFVTGSDYEPPLHLYRREGLPFIDRLRGMYAMAVQDGREGRMLLSRDPFGIKPLYYVVRPDGVAFASEPQALLAAGLAARAVNPAALKELLQLQFTTRQETIFPQIERVLPGETIVVAGGRIVERHHRAALSTDGPVEMDEEQALAALDAALVDSVAVHQRADVPYGLFLSGGIDSTAILAAMARLNERPVLAFTAWFDHPSVSDEREAARAAARSFGAEHVEVAFGQRDFWELLPQVAAAMDDPAADYACLPTFKLAAVARRQVKVVLSGEGGDELFAGYGRYRDMIRPWWRGGRPMRRRGIFEGMEVLRDPGHGWRDGIVAAEANAARGDRTRLQVAQAIDCTDWLPNDLLAKLDRCLMAHGVEGRTPFLDPAVAALAYRLPDRLKVRGGFGKWILRRWLERHAPAAQPFAAKRGFTVPIGGWIAPEAARLGPLVAAQPGIAEICKPQAVERLFSALSGKREGFAAWTLLFYALWHRRHILDRPVIGDAFACLEDSAGAG